MRGRPRKPTALKVLQGTFRKDRANPNEPQPAVGSVLAPSHLSQEEREVWQVTVRVLQEMRVFTQADAGMLSRYCELSCLWQETKKNALMLPTSKTVSLLLKISVELRSIEVQFGMSPSSRSRVHTIPHDDKPQSKLSKYLPGEKAARRRLLFGDDAS